MFFIKTNTTLLCNTSSRVRAAQQIKHCRNKRRSKVSSRTRICICSQLVQLERWRAAARRFRLKHGVMASEALQCRRRAEEMLLSRLPPRRHTSMAVKYSISKILGRHQNVAPVNNTVVRSLTLIRHGCGSSRSPGREI